MKKHFLLNFLIILFLSLAIIPHYAFAHFPETDGAITAVLHVDPNDDPAPGQQANLYFLFNDTTKKFNLVDCNCTVSITEQGKQLYRQSLVEKKDGKPSVWGAAVPYTFPARDVYHIVLTGNPKTVNAFQPFTLSWDFRVDSNFSGLASSENTSDIKIIWELIIGGIIVLILFGIFIKKEIINAEQ